MASGISDNFSSVLASSGLFPELALRLVGLGEQNGQLHGMLLRMGCEVTDLGIVPDDREATIAALADAAVRSRPRVTVEPGRSIAGRAGVTLYTVGTVKDIPGVRTEAIRAELHLERRLLEFA